MNLLFNTLNIQVAKKIPVCSPKLLIKQISKYIEKIDNNRYYSNFGPLSVSLENRLSQHLGFSKNVAAVSVLERKL